MTQRQSKNRQELRQILVGGSGHAVLLDIRDDVNHLLGRDAEGSLVAQIEACRRVGCDANVIVGEADYLPADHPFGRKRRIVRQQGRNVVVEVVQPTPLGPLMAEEVYEPGQKPARTRMFLETESDYQAAIALLRELRNFRSDITAHLAEKRREMGDAGLLTVFVPQPLELFFLILHDNMVMHYLDWPETYAAAMDEVEKTSHVIIDCAADAGADLIMCGGAGTEIFNPEMIERHIIRSGAQFIRHCRERGLLSLMHCCGRTNIFLERNWFDQLRPTIFESFTPLPLGDIVSPEQAAMRLPMETFFKGGLSLDRLLRGTPQEAVDATQQAYAQFGGRRFILAGTCAVLTGTPLENLQAVTATAASYEHKLS